jgi:uncharacterized membrane protein
MTILIVGLVIFFAVHFLPSMTAVRQGLIARRGEGPYKGLFSVVSLIGFGLIIWGYSQSEFVAVYDPPAWGRHVTMALVLLAFICFAYFHLKSRIRKAIGHPMLFGIALWAIGHLFANGDQASLLLFGSFLVFSVIDILIANAQGRVKQFEVKPAHDFIGVGVGVVLYVVFFALHPYIIGVPII